MAATLDLSKAVSQLLEEYGDDVNESIDKALKSVKTDAVNVLKEKSPKRSGQYARGWRAEDMKVAYGMHQIVLHNKTDWMLTHLLNQGFYSVRAGQRVAGDGHIDAAESVINEMLIKKVEDSL